MTNAPSPHKQLIDRYLDGFRTMDHQQILSCLTEDIEWTVFGHFHIRGKAAYDEQIDGDGFAGCPTLDVVRMIEEGDTVMAELTGSVARDDGTTMRMSMAEVFRFRDGLICERRAFVVPLLLDDVR